MTESNVGFDLIHSYTRKQAIEDGVLINITDVAHRFGFIIPVAVTQTVYNKYIDWSNEDTVRQKIKLDINDRLQEILFMLRCAIKNYNLDVDTLVYLIRVIPRDGQTIKSQHMTHKTMMGPGDQCEPVMTILLPDED